MANIKRLRKTEEGTNEAQMENAPRYTEEEARKLGRVQFYMVLGLFIGVGIITELISYFLGKTAGTIGLCIIAGIVAVFLYKDEILSRFSRKNH